MCEYGHTTGVAGHRLKCLGSDGELKLGGEAYRTEYAQRIVAEGDIRFEGGAYYAGFEIAHPVVAVYEFAEARAVEAYCHGVDGEVAPRYVLVQSSVFDHGVARVAVIALASGAYKLQLGSAPAKPCGAEAAEDRNLDFMPQRSADCAGQVDTRAYGDEVYVL